MCSAPSISPCVACYGEMWTILMTTIASARSKGHFGAAGSRISGASRLGRLDATDKRRHF